LFCRHSWYVIGRSSLHSAVRTFNLSRISSLEVLPKRFSVPRDFSIERHLRNAWALIPGDGPDQRVVVRFKPLVARNVGEVIWHQTQELEFQEDGSLIFRARVSGIQEIAWWILGYGDQAEVLKPTELRRLVAHRAKNMAAMYNGEE
jgi:proteasome accessory factor B